MGEEGGPVVEGAEYHQRVGPETPIHLSSFR